MSISASVMACTYLCVSFIPFSVSVYDLKGFSLYLFLSFSVSEYQSLMLLFKFLTLVLATSALFKITIKTEATSQNKNLPPPLAASIIIPFLPSDKKGVRENEGVGGLV